MVKVGRTAMLHFTYRGAPEDPYQRMEMISLVLIESIEPIEAGQAA
jgi:hypothetical protein